MYIVVSALGNLSVPTHHVAILHTARLNWGMDPMAGRPPKMAIPRNACPVGNQAPLATDIQVTKMELVYLLAGAMGKHSHCNA